MFQKSFRILIDLGISQINPRKGNHPKRITFTKKATVIHIRIINYFPCKTPHSVLCDEESKAIHDSFYVYSFGATNLPNGISVNTSFDAKKHTVDFTARKKLWNIIKVFSII